MNRRVTEKRKLWLFSIITIIAVIIISISVGQFNLTSFPFGASLNKPISYTENDDALKATVDRSGKRISIINNNNEALNLISLDQSEIASNISIAQYALIYKNQVYVFGYLADEKYTGINNVVGLKLSLQGKFIEKIMDIKQTDDEFYTINNIRFDNDRIYIVVSSFHNVFFIESNTDSTLINNENVASYESQSLNSCIYDIIYLDNIDSYIIFDALGNRYVKNKNGLQKETNINQYFNNCENQIEIYFSDNFFNDKSFTLIDKSTNTSNRYNHIPLSLNISNNVLHYANNENDTTLKINLYNSDKEENNLYLFIPLFLI